MDSKGKLIVYDAEADTNVESETLERTPEQWKELLTATQFSITRRKGTERAFSGPYHDFKGDAIFKCVCCGLDLYSTEHKFDSGTGWPSFDAPVSELNVRTESDNSLFMRRTEVHCARCGAHLGHIFDDGPQSTGNRHCINSASLVVDTKEQEKV